MSVEVLCEKSFSEVDEEIIDVLVEFHEAMIGGDVSRLNEIISDDFELSGMFAQKQSKGDFVSMVEDGTLDLSKSDIMDPTILWDDENASSLICDMRLTAKINGNERRWISKAVVSFKKVDGEWGIAGWEN